MSALSFLYPAALSIALLAPLLFLAYLHRSPLKRRIVASIILLRELPKTPTIRDRVKLPWRFFLEALILLLLAFLAAYPKWSDRGARVAILLDNSLSMNALGSREKRFESAKNELKSWLELQSEKDHFTLFVTSPKLTKLSADLVESSVIAQSLSDATVSSGPDYLDGALSQIVSSGEFERAFVLSDKRANFSATASSHTFPVDARVVGENVPNLALVNLRLDRQQGQVQSIVAALSSYGDRTTQARLRATAKGSVIAETQIQLEPKRIVEARVAIGKQAAEIIRVELIPADIGLDAITLDDIGYIDVGRSESKNILLVSDADLGGDTLGLASLGAEGITGLSYTALSDEAVQEYRTVIFHGLLPRNLPKSPSLIISPPLENRIFPGVKELSAPSVSSWNTESPLTSYLNFGLLKIGRTVVFDPPDWTQTIVNVEQGPVVISGEESGVRRAAVGFEILPFEGKKTPTLSVFTLNILSWLSGGAQFEETLRTGALIPVPKQQKWEVFFPGGRVVSSEELSKEDGPLRADVAGLYRIRSAGLDQRLVVNAFHPDESATNEQGFFEATLSTDATEESEGESYLWRDLLQIAVLLLLGDLVARGIVLLRMRHA